MARPETKDHTTVLDRVSITEPISHDGSSDRATSGLEESEDEVHEQDEGIGKGHVDRNKVKPDSDVDEDKAATTPEKTNGKDGGGIERISELPVDDISSSIGRHKDRVHGRNEGGGVTSFMLKLLLDGGVTLSRKVRHEVSSEGDEECPSDGGWGAISIPDNMYRPCFTGRIQNSDLCQKPAYCDNQ